MFHVQVQGVQPVSHFLILEVNMKIQSNDKEDALKLTK